MSDDAASQMDNLTDQKYTEEVTMTIDRDMKQRHDNEDDEDVLVILPEGCKLYFCLKLSFP